MELLEKVDFDLEKLDFDDLFNLDDLDDKLEGVGAWSELEGGDWRVE